MSYFIFIIIRRNIADNLNLYHIRKEIVNYSKLNFFNFQFKEFSFVKDPKISLIITLYNQKQYILKIYACILDQSLEEIEIISTDNSFSIIRKLMNKDKRIIYLKNDKNKGQFFSRNKGIIYSRGDYVLIIDPDDLLLNDILIKSYKMAKQYLLDIVQFYHLMGNYKNNQLVIINSKSEICFQPETNNIFFDYHTRYLWDKLIRRKILIKSIFFMKDSFRKERFIIHNDETACFGIFTESLPIQQQKKIFYQKILMVDFIHYLL